MVIVNWNSGALLRSCIASLFSVPDDLSLQIIVIDNDSKDGSANFLRDSNSGVELIANSHNVGFSKACNRGLGRARGRYILLLNPDTEVLPAAMASMVAVADGDERIAVVGPQLVYPDSTLQPSCVHFPSLRRSILDLAGLNRLFPRSEILAGTYMLSWGHDSQREVEYMMGACLLMRTASVRALGGFDERFYMYFEETDLCRRIRSAGWTCVYTPHARVVHHAGVSSIQNLHVRWVVYHQCELLYFAKHWGAWHVLVMRVIICVHFTVRTLSLPIAVARLRRKGASSASWYALLSYHAQVIRSCFVPIRKLKKLVESYSVSDGG